MTGKSTHGGETPADKTSRDGFFRAAFALLFISCTSLLLLLEVIPTILRLLGFNF